MTAPTLTCSCGMPYTDTPSGRHAHRVLHGHSACQAREVDE